MLISRQHLIAFAHYPKMAGCSVQRWFKDWFPDAVLLRPKNPHLCVADSLKKLSRWKWTWPIVRLATSQSRFALPRVRDCVEPWPMSLRVVGVIREPFEMFVSLYKYWRRDVFPIEPTEPYYSSRPPRRVSRFFSGRIDRQENVHVRRFFQRWRTAPHQAARLRLAPGRLSQFLSRHRGPQFQANARDQPESEWCSRHPALPR